MSSGGNTEDVILDFCNASQQEQGKRKNHTVMVYSVAMDCNIKQYSWKNGIRTSPNRSFFSYPKDEADNNEWCRLIKTMQ